MRNKSVTFLTGLVDKKIIKIIVLFVSSEREFFHINSVSQKTHVPLASCFRIIKQLHKEGIITAKTIGKLRIYTLADTEKALFFKSMIGGKNTTNR